MAVLELKSVHYKYVNPFITVEAVQSVDYRFERGRLYALRGPSGSGKTTLLSLMAGLDLPTGGDVLFEGKSTRNMNLDRYRRENVSVIYQSYNLLPMLTVTENVMYPMELNHVRTKKARKAALSALGQVGLTEKEGIRFPSMLSGGQQQRVAIARALCSKAGVLLADEPTGSLDEENGRMIMEQLYKLAHERDYCVIVVTHDDNMAEWADTKLYLKDGHLKDIDGKLKSEM